MERRRCAWVLGSAATALGIARVMLAIPVAYLTVVTSAAWLATATRRRAADVAEPRWRFAILVPAHDEELVIAETVGALMGLDYPSTHYAVHVLADHCEDATASLARLGGAEVHERTTGERGKGPTLAEAIERLLGGDLPPDAVVVIDADTIAAPEFLRAAAVALDAGATVVQGQYRVRRPEASTAASLRAVALALRHHVRPLGRTWLGASSGLYGNGMVFASSVLAGRQWTNHLTEDIELQLQLLLDGTPVTYAPDAVVEAEMPASLDAAQTQNERWERGRLDIARRYVPRLARRALQAVGRERIAAADAALDQLVPPLSVLIAGTMAVVVAGAAVDTVQRGSPGWSTVTLPFALTAHVATGLALGKLPRSSFVALRHVPTMVVWKVRLWARMLTDKQEMRWVRTAHVGTAS